MRHSKGRAHSAGTPFAPSAAGAKAPGYVNDPLGCSGAFIFYSCVACYNGHFTTIMPVTVPSLISLLLIILSAPFAQATAVALSDFDSAGHSNGSANSGVSDTNIGTNVTTSSAGGLKSGNHHSVGTRDDQVRLQAAVSSEVEPSSAALLMGFAGMFYLALRFRGIG